MSQVLWTLWIGDVDDRRAVRLLFPRQRIERIPAVVTDVGDPARTLPLDHGLIRTSRLEILVANKLHVVFFRPVLRGSSSLSLCSCADAKKDAQRRQGQMRGFHVRLLTFESEPSIQTLRGKV